MSLPQHSYFLSPLNDQINDSRYSHLLATALAYVPLELQNHDQLLNIYNVEVQPARIFDIMTTFRIALHDQTRSSLLLLAESLRVRERPLPAATDFLSA